ncbi:hypothetical protein G8770_04490 [Aestuariicella hydrocarbonica]|uniref:Uncharacterized protein n=1 Tax=Pseudomaricurvus hydrocarbonicus TaxID=1470433 RepID=A0A9E5JUH9_9GAMM|nr:hypothetical protein [Aestuariicella hydrocarbonica]NHO64796.1 hypothetical protein [Aestuariicella hydrocarbonica]
MMAVNTHAKARPDLFSRGALELTFRVLRRHKPQLAMDVQNILQGNKVEAQTLKPLSRVNPKSTADHFYVSLPPQTIGQVVKALTHLGEEMLAQPDRGNGKLLIIRTLMKDWMDLADWIIMQVERPTGARR